MKTRTINPFGLRLQPENKERAKAEAERNRRSLNAELEVLIEEGFRWRAMQSQQASI